MRRGFTLVELMIVVAVLAILASLVLPLVNRNVDTAGRSAAVMTERSIRSAADLYKSESGRWPVEFTSGMFQAGEIPRMPPGYLLAFNTYDGETALYDPDNPPGAIGDPWIVVADGTE